MVFVMALTSSLLVLIMIMIWKTHIALVVLYILVIGSVELIYLSSVLYKFDRGGYLPLAFSIILVLIMFVWNYVYRKKYMYEVHNKVSIERVKDMASDPYLRRLPGLALFYSELVQGIPPIFKHYVDNVPALHSVLVFVSIKSLPISKVPVEERFLFRRVEPRELAVFRCVARYGYTDARSNDQEPFERAMVERLKEFIREDGTIVGIVNASNGSEEVEDHVREMILQEAADKEIEMVERAMSEGVVHLLGENDVVASKGGSVWKRVLVDYAYNYLKRNLRQSDKVLDVPHKRLLKVGMTYEI